MKNILSIYLFTYKNMDTFMDTDLHLFTYLHVKFSIINYCPGNYLLFMQIRTLTLFALIHK